MTAIDVSVADFDVPWFAPAPGDLAACLDADPDLFFADDPNQIAAAKAYCAECPVRLECLVGALRRAEPHGVWGGELFDGGTVIARKRPRGRPRKEDPAANSEAADRRLAADIAQLVASYAA